MRHRPALVLALSLFVPALAHGDDRPAPVPLQAGKQALQVTVDLDKVDLDGHRLEVKMNRPAGKVKIKVFSMANALLAEVEKAFDGAAPNTPLVMTWTPSSKEAVGKIEIYAYDSDANWKGVAITPWNVKIPHEEVNFETNSDVIRATEVPKLESSLQKVQEELKEAAKRGGDMSKVTLFIQGHTDTVGSAEHNLMLSRKRARSIATWFRGKGLKNPIAYEGLGEHAPAVKTADEVDEPKNRRVDYILGMQPPRLPTGGNFGWKAL